MRTALGLPGVLLLAVLGMAGCAMGLPSFGKAAAEAPTLTGTRWVVQSVEPSADTGFDWAGQGVDMTLDGGTGSAGGFGGCNHWSAEFTAEEPDRLHFGRAVATRMACASPPGAMQREQEFFNVLAKIESYRLSGTELDLSGRDESRIVLKAGSS